MDRPILYLDTKDISTLAKHPTIGGAPSILAALRGRECYLGVSLLHLVELADPRFVDQPKVGALLDSVPLAWALHQSDLFDREIDAVVRSVLSGSAATAVAFYRDPIQAWGMDEPAHILPSEMLSALSQNPGLGGQIRGAAGQAANNDKLLKTQAAAVQRPLEPLAAGIKERQLRRTPSGLHLLRPLDAEELIAKAGGLAAFPAYQVFQSMGVTRFKDHQFPSVPNDVLDDWHAVYAPYTAVTVLDRGTVGRFRSTRLPYQERVFSRLEDASKHLVGVLGQNAA